MQSEEERAAVSRPRDIRPMDRTDDAEHFQREYARCVNAVASEVWHLAIDLYELRVRPGVSYHQGEGSDYRRAKDSLDFVWDVTEQLRDGMEQDAWELAADRDVP